MKSGKKDTVKSQEDIFKSNSKILSEHYDIGQLIYQERIYRGYINDNYKIEMLRGRHKSRYLMRHYRKGTPEDKIKFEHALLHELQIRKFKLSPRLILAKDDSGYVGIGRQLENQAHENYIAVFSFLPGNDKYCWDSPFCTDEEIKNSAKILSLYHNTIFNWKGIGFWRELNNFDAINLMAIKWKAYTWNTAKSPFHDIFLEQFDVLISMINFIPPQKIYHALPRLAVHGDYHPGNLKFKGGNVTGVFDFGWSKIDARCFDVGLAIMYFCTNWENINDGILQLDRVENFLGAYQETAKKNQTIGPLNKLELEYLPHMIHFGNLIVVDWILGDFYGTGQYPQQYLKYLQHSMSLNRWLECNWEKLESCIQRHST
jgi:homoserine kinase type II